MNEKREYRGYIASLIFHIILGIIFLNIYIDLSPQMPEFFELTFTTVTRGKTVDRVYVPPPPRVSEPAGEKVRIVEKKDVVELPKRKMVDVTEPEISVTKKEKVFVDDSPTRLKDKTEVGKKPERKSQEKILDILSPESKVSEISEVPVSENVQSDTLAKDAGVNISALQSYTIEWGGSPREKIRGNLPTYPKGIYKTAIIRLRFNVFPNGTVGEIIPLQKGSTILENNAINALKEWLFNPLENNAPQVIQEGIIAFIYKLE